MRAVIYARVSGDDRNNATSSLEGQLELCRDYATSKGWQVVQELAEDSRGASGAAVDLPQLNEALDLARNGRFDVLVTREIDRLARSLAKQLIVEQEFERFGVKIDYVIGDYQSTPEGQLSKHIRAVIAEYEREKIKERMVRGRRNKVRKGHVMLHGNAPYGYRAANSSEETGLVIDESTAEVVRMIFGWYINEGWGTPTIARKLNERGIEPPSVAKKSKSPHAVAWNQAQVNRVLRNETYAGRWRYGKRGRNGLNPEDHHIVVEVPAIVSPEVYARAQKRRSDNTWRSKRNTRREYLLGRRCRCGECGAAMIAFTKHDRNGRTKYPYYRCPVPHTQGTHHMHQTCGMTKHFRADIWDKQVWRALKEFISKPEILERGFVSYLERQREAVEPLENRLAIVDDLIEKKGVELSRLLDLYLAGTFDEGLLIDRKQRLEETLTHLQTERDAIKKQLGQYHDPEQLARIKRFARRIALRFPQADDDFALRDRLVESLGVWVVFAIENGEQVAYLNGEFGPTLRLVLDDEANGTPSPQPLSGQTTNSLLGAADNCRSIGMHNMGYTRS